MSRNTIWISNLFYNAKICHITATPNTNNDSKMFIYLVQMHFQHQSSVLLLWISYPWSGSLTRLTRRMGTYKYCRDSLFSSTVTFYLFSETVLIKLVLVSIPECIIQCRSNIWNKIIASIVYLETSSAYLMILILSIHMTQLKVQNVIKKNYITHSLKFLRHASLDVMR